jgi:hypothetical protein
MQTPKTEKILPKGFLHAALTALVGGFALIGIDSSLNHEISHSKIGSQTSCINNHHAARIQESEQSKIIYCGMGNNVGPYRVQRIYCCNSLMRSKFITTLIASALLVVTGCFFDCAFAKRTNTYDFFGAYKCKSFS